MALLQKNGIPVPDYAFVRTREEAMAAAAARDTELVMKVVSPQIIHKSDVGGVILHISTPEQAGEAFDRLEKIGEGNDFRGAILCPMLKSGKEVILGLTRDSQFGPVVAFGMGGIYTEVLKDVTFRVAPVSEEMPVNDRRDQDVSAAERRSWRVWLRSGCAGKGNCRIFGAAVPVSGSRKSDLNPIFLYEDGLCAVDARILGKR